MLLLTACDGHLVQIEGLPVYGVAIPTVRGLRNVLDAVGAFKGEHHGSRCPEQLATATGPRRVPDCTMHPDEPTMGSLISILQMF
jgi:hypothetical protein